MNPMDTKEILHEIFFAGGCFWGVEEYFSRIPGVRETSVGYANGNTEKPDYRSVCTGDTGHTETVRVLYDPPAKGIRLCAGTGGYASPNASRLPTGLP